MPDPRQHGRTEYYIEGEGFAPPMSMLRPIASAVPGTAAADNSETMGAIDPPTVDPNRAFRFCRLFPDLPPFRPGDEALVALGKSMVDDRDTPGRDSPIPSGFTYFGQFVDHDITFDRTVGIPDGALEPEEIVQGRTPSLELDSLYGRGPLDSPELYDTDGVHLRLGTTTGRTAFGVTDSFPNDLPRRPPSDPIPAQAIIADPRNDEHLIVAQMHVAFIKFHNQVVAHLAASGTVTNELFDVARKTVVQHYQSIVWHDFVCRLAAPNVWAEMTTNKRSWFLPSGSPQRKDLCMPIEFSAAAYRLGHSMIRNRYEWNRVFSSTGRLLPDLALFFTFSQMSGTLGGEPTLPSDWIVDWRRMFDFGQQPGSVRHSQLNFARPIDTHLARDLRNLPQFFGADPQHLKFLPVRNLLRGRLLGLPTGQDVAAKLAVTPLTSAEVAAGTNAQIITDHGFDQQTPLWFYVLKEAEVRHAGQHLGEVGSRLVVETFQGLIEGSEHSIFLDSKWKPTLPSQDADHFSMNDLLLFINDLNPIGD